MKTLIVLVLAVIGTQAAVVQSPESTDINVEPSAEAIFGVGRQNSTLARSTINIGFIGVRDSLLHRSFHRTLKEINVRHQEEEEYRGGWFTKISAIRVTEVISVDGSNAQIVSGGLGQNRVTVRFTSARGGSYFYQFEVWG